MEAEDNESASDSISIASTESSSITSVPEQPDEHPSAHVSNWEHVSKKPHPHDDETSEMSISDASSDPEDHDQSLSRESDVKNTAPATTSPAGIDRKRRFSSPNNTFISGPHRENGQITVQKRRKIERTRQSFRTAEGRLFADRSSLPVEIWRCILVYVPPRTLGRAIRVCKAFRTFLDPEFDAAVLAFESGQQQVGHKRSADEVWQASRRAFLPGMPTPLQGKSELAMWKLACGRSCESCGRAIELPMMESNPWQQGPGASGIRSVWHFSNRLCGPCLLARSIKEIDLLLSSSVPSALLVALPFIFVTDDHHVVTAGLLSQGSQPPNIRIAKHFDKLNVNAIKDEFFKVKSMGHGTAEEWLKGLDGRGKDASSDASRWERWEAAGGLRRMRQVDTTTSLPKTTEATSKSKSTNSAHPLPTPLPQMVSNVPNTGVPSLPRLSNIQKPLFVQNIPQVNIVGGQGLNLARPVPGPRQERTREEVAALKATRRRDIEGRAARLTPPIPPSVLVHMASFQAAIQIITPFDDRAWELLKPRLLSQKAEAEKREGEIAEQTRLIQEQLNERRNQELQVKEAREAIDREWEDAQEPLRARMGSYAEELIKDGWQNAEKVNQETCTKFAADVLLYVRKRFYAEVVKDNAALRAAGHEPDVDPPDGPFTQKLTLENMKWLFDTKVKPCSEQYRKELFLCGACQVNNKYYGFEGVIQHYAAKHTNVLSIGSVIVHWRAEWPDPPPFHSDPMTFANTPIQSMAPTGIPITPTAMSSHNQSNGYGSHVHTVGVPSSIGQIQSLPAYIQVGHRPGTIHYGPQYTGSPGTFFQAQVAVPAGSYASAPTNASQQWQVTEHVAHNYHHSAAINQYAPTLSTTAVAGPSNLPSSHPSGSAPVVTHHAQASTPDFVKASTPNAAQQSNGLYRSAEYRTQLLSVARAARDSWNTISAIKDVPGSVRVHIVLFFVLKAFRAEYEAEPPLTMLIDGLSNNKDMRPVRNINGLACRACSLEKAYNNNTHARPSKGSHVDEKKLLSFPQLLNHFQSEHVIIEKDDVAQFSWTTDMVELPERRKLSSIGRTITFNDKQKSMIEEALPEAFTVTPEPMQADEIEQYVAYETRHGEHSKRELPPSVDKHKLYYTSPAPDEASEYQDEGDLQEETEALARYLSYNNKQQAPATIVENLVTSRTETNDKHKHAKKSGRRQRSTGVDNGLTSFRKGNAQNHKALISDIPADSLGDSLVGATMLPEAQSLEYLLACNTTNTRAPETASQAQEVLLASHSQPNASDRYVLREATDPAPHRLQNPSRRVERYENLDNGSEDGEVQSESIAQYAKRNLSPDEPSAAERFLAEFLPGESSEDYFRKAREAERQGEEALRARYLDEQYNIRHSNMTQQADTRRMSRRSYIEDEEYVPGMRTLEQHGNTALPERPYSSRQRHEQDQLATTFEHQNHHVYPTQQVSHMQRQAEDFRYHDDNVVYVESRKSRPPFGNSIDSPQIPENTQPPGTRVRSRSPLYMTDGGLVRAYRERSYLPHYQEPMYHDQEPMYHDQERYPPIEGQPYARVPHREYVHDYVNGGPSTDSRPEEEIQYIEMEDAQGKYLVRRPIRKDRVPLYVEYENDQRLASSKYMNDPPTMVERAFDEEYDPRNPAPLPPVTTRQIRYQ